MAAASGPNSVSRVAMYLIEGHARREASIDERPSLVAIGTEQDGNAAEGAGLEQLSRLSGNVDSVDDRGPLRTSCLQHLLKDIRRSRQQNLIARLGPQAREQ